RQYRRLALILHPDKNRHPDAEAAFKKLTAAFEKLHDPARQAMCRSEATHSTRNPRQGRGSHSRSSDSSGSTHEFDGGLGGAGARSWGSKATAAEAPRWCREGEYVPEAEGKKTTPSRPMDEFMEDFEQQEKAFKEEVAQAKERNAEKKRAKAEARSAADAERIDRLREDLLGGKEDESEVEAKTASWQNFNAKATAQKRKAGGGRRENAKRSNAEFANSGQGGRLGVGGGSSERSPETAPTDRPKPPGGKAAGPGFVCWVCRRGFKSAKGLAQHEAKSELHEINVQLKDFLPT
ncbi:unnamed protein product, partial [Hapterophycus canaliculatus]